MVPVVAAVLGVRDDRQAETAAHAVMDVRSGRRGRQFETRPCRTSSWSRPGSRAVAASAGTARSACAGPMTGRSWRLRWSAAGSGWPGGRHTDPRSGYRAGTRPGRVACRGRTADGRRNHSRGRSAPQRALPSVSGPAAHPACPPRAVPPADPRASAGPRPPATGLRNELHDHHELHDHGENGGWVCVWYSSIARSPPPNGSPPPRRPADRTFPDPHHNGRSPSAEGDFRSTSDVSAHAPVSRGGPDRSGGRKPVRNDSETHP